MEYQSAKHGPTGFRWLAGFSVFWALLLIWVGAAVTTENVGMVVPDWPLSFGQINPQGWWKVMPVLLEHGHRWLGAIMGLLVLAMAVWLWLRERQPWWEILLLGGAFVAVVIVLGAGNYGLGAVIGLATFVWLGAGWKLRGWSLLLKLTMLALFAVVLQGVKGGLRVLEVSNVMAIAHGVFAQAFFCLLLLIWLVGGRATKPRSAGVASLPGAGTSGGILILAAIFIQLGLGATMRHTHRYGLVADDIVTTGGSFLPSFADFDLAVMFLHKWWAVVVWALVLGFTWWCWRRAVPLRPFALLLSVLITAQVALGVGVLWFGKTFWVTNFHVLNGLAVLATSFLMVVHAFRTATASRGVAESRSVGDAPLDAQVQTG